MTCEHRYKVRERDGKGEVYCQRCGDIRIADVPLSADREAIADRVAWERKRRDSPIWLPPDIGA